MQETWAAPIDDTDRPEVTVILITYNDAEHLQAAVDSVLTQTLRSLELIVVDDHSTDDTPDLMTELILKDSRVRYERLATNSGGCGAPRNRGLALAAGRYVTFLDSDDTLERHACKNLLMAARRTGAELVLGQIKRFHHANKRYTPWYPWLFKETAFYPKLAERPELVHDTAATAKLYSAEFLKRIRLQFVVPMHYEELVFTAYAYREARGIALVPEIVYLWHVYPEAQRKSISNQRDSIRNLRDRISAVDAVSRILENQPYEVRYQLCSKALRHHYRLYFDDLLSSTGKSASKVVNILGRAIAAIPVDGFQCLSTWERLAYAYLIEGDLNSVQLATLSARHGFETGCVVSVDGDRYWTGSPKCIPPTDPKALELARLGPKEFVRNRHAAGTPLSEIVQVTQHAGRIVIHGRTSDVFGRLKEELDGATLAAIGGDRKHAQRIPLETRYSGGCLEWTATFDGIHPKGVLDTRARRLVIDTKLVSGAINRSPLRLPVGAEPLVVPNHASGRLGRLLVDEFWRSNSGDLKPLYLDLCEPTSRSRLIRKTSQAVLRLRSLPGNLRKALLRPVRATGRFGIKIVYPLLRHLPLKPDSAFFESHMGNSVGDSPFAVYEAMRQAHPNIQVTWSVTRSRRLAELTGCNIVKRNSYAYLLALARTTYLVDNQSFPWYFRKRKGQRYLQTWHGIPLKKMGLDLLSDTPTPAQVRSVTKYSAQWDGLVVPCQYFEDVFVPAFAYGGDLIRGGTPRNDSLVHSSTFDRRRLEYILDIPAGQRVVLYAPTFRKGLANRRRPVKLPFDLRKWRNELGESVTLLVRAHYLNRFSIAKAHEDYCVDVSGYENLNELLLLADVLVTDYSSIMFDYLVLNRAVVNYCYDYDKYYGSERGAYLDLRVDSPGYFVEARSEFYGTLREALNSGAKAEQGVFAETYGPREDGRAAERSLAYLIDGVVP